MSQPKIALLNQRQTLEKGKELAMRHMDEWDEGKYTAAEWSKILTSEAQNEGLGTPDAIAVAEEAMIYFGVNAETIKSLKGASTKQGVGRKEKYDKALLAAGFQKVWGLVFSIRSAAEGLYYDRGFAFVPKNITDADFQQLDDAVAKKFQVPEDEIGTGYFGWVYHKNHKVAIIWGGGGSGGYTTLIWLNLINLGLKVGSVEIFGIEKYSIEEPLEVLRWIKTANDTKIALDALNIEIDRGEHPDHRAPSETEDHNYWYGTKGTEPEQNKFGDLEKDNVEKFAPGAKKKLRDFDRMPERFKDIKNFDRKRKERPAAPRTASHDTHEIEEAGWQKIVDAPEYSRYTNPSLPDLILEVANWGFTLFTQDTEGNHVPLEQGDLNNLDGFLTGLAGTGKFATTKKYPDSAAGAIAYLKDESTFNLKGAKAKMDPSVEGVWLVIMANGEHAIVYLAGYKDPLGKIREKNDFEEVEPPSKTPKKAQADDMCEACGKRVANRECAHGILCDKCDKDVHGKKGGPCKIGAKKDKILRPGEYEQPKELHPKWKQDEEDAYQQEEQERADEEQSKISAPKPTIVDFEGEKLRCIIPAQVMKAIKKLSPESGVINFKDEQGVRWTVTLLDTGNYQFKAEDFDILGDVSLQQLTGKTAEIKMHETPRILPPREDMRRHIDEDLKKELQADDDIEKTSAPAAPAQRMFKKSPTTPAMIEDIKEPKQPSSYAYDPRMLNQTVPVAEHPGGAPSWVTGSAKIARPEIRAVINEMAKCPKCKTCVNHAAIMRLVQHLKDEHGLGEFAQTVSEEIFKLISDTREQPDMITGAVEAGKIEQNMRCPSCKNSPIYREDSGSGSRYPYFCHVCNRGFVKPLPIHPDDPAYRKEKIQVPQEGWEIDTEEPSSNYKADPDMLNQITRFGSMKTAEFAELWDSATPRGRCKLLGISGKPTTVLFFKPWTELNDREKGLLSNWLRVQRLNPGKAASEDDSYWLDEINEAEDNAKATFMQDPNMIDLARMYGVDMETLWEQEREEYMKVIYDPKP